MYRITHRNTRFRIALPFLIPFCAIFFTCLMMMFYTIYNGINSRITNSQALLHQSAERISKELKIADLMAEDINLSSSTKELSMLLQSNGAANLSSNLFYTLEHMPQLSQNLDLIFDYQLYNFNNNCLYGNGYAVSNLERYYRTCSSINSLSVEEWIDTVLKGTNYYRLEYVGELKWDYQKTDNSYKYPDGMKIICYRIPYISRYTQQVSGNINFYINADNLVNSILNLGESSIMYLLSDEGQVIYSIDSQIQRGEFFPTLVENGGISKIGRQRHVFSTYALPEYGVSIVVSTPLSFFVKDAFYSLRTVLMIAAIMIVICAIFINKFSIAAIRPLAEVIRSIGWFRSQQTNTHGDFWLIKDAFDALQTENSSIYQSLLGNTQLLQDKLIHQMVFIGNLKESELSQCAETLNLSNRNAMYCGMVMQIDMNDLSVEDEYNILTDIANEHNEHFRRLFMNAPGQWMWILISEESETIDDRLMVLSAFRETFLERYGLTTLLFVGSCCTELNQLNESFSNARNMSTMCERWPGQFIIYADAMEYDLGDCSYSIADEQRIIHLVEIGDLHELNSMLDDVYKRNFTNVYRDAFFKHLIYSLLINTLFRIDAQIRIPEDVRESFFEYSPDMFFNQIKALFMQAVQLRTEKNQYRRDDIITKVKQYLQDNYSDSTLSLTSVASNFGFSESYLSVLFKKNVGVTYSNYIESIRIEKAKQLLSEGKNTVEEVSARVGYNYVTSFRRAYKRIVGYTPSERYPQENRTSKNNVK